MSAIDLLAGRKWAACGDSFTNGDFKGYAGQDHVFADGPFAGQFRTYDRLIAERCGMVLQHLAMNGMCLATPVGAAKPNAFTLGQYREIDEDADYITLCFGINDSHHRPRASATDGEDTRGVVTLGAADDTDPHTFCGAWNTVLAWLSENRPFAHVGILVSNGCETDDYRLATIAAARRWGIPYLDLNGDERTPCMGRSTNPAILPDVRAARTRLFAVDPPRNTHPNAAAHRFESGFIEAWLRTL